MNEISCPHCSKVFKVDETGYADILKQVRDHAFEEQLQERLQVAAQEKENALALAEEKLSRKFQKEAQERESQIQSLNNKLEANKTQLELATTKAVSAVEKERDALQTQLIQARQDHENETKLAAVAKETALQEATSQKDLEIQNLKSQLQSKDTTHQLAITQALSEVEKERDQLKNNLEHSTLEKQIAEKALQDKYETQLKDRDDAIERLRDMKAKLSTKMVGETLEQHCETEFNRLRSTAFHNAYFEKDNDSRSGSKGDFIFREENESETEIVSIMFEMKNESDTTQTKKKNEDFFKELDKDRTEKGCEYAILVSLLEPESELYNTGIVDVSHRYQKMYVIRPQFFIPIITLLRNAAMNSLTYKNELALVKAQNIDVTNFESDLTKFKDAFGRNYELASRQFQTAVDEIDKSIIHLQKTKEALLKSSNNMRLANNKAQDVTVKKLVRDNHTMKEKFEQSKAQENRTYTE